MSDLLILAHAASWEMRFQTTALAASAAAAGERVDLALFFGALDAWVAGRWDDLDPAPPVTAARIETSGLPPLSHMLVSGREQGRIRLYACSTSMRLLGIDPAALQAAVDAVLGWQSFSRMIQESSRVVTL